MFKQQQPSSGEQDVHTYSTICRPSGSSRCFKEIFKIQCFINLFHLRLGATDTHWLQKLYQPTEVLHESPSSVE